eukprot:112540-Chlamydomonas_euryale.AAC.1
MACCCWRCCFSARCMMRSATPVPDPSTPIQTPDPYTLSVPDPSTFETLALCLAPNHLPDICPPPACARTSAAPLYRTARPSTAQRAPLPHSAPLYRTAPPSTAQRAPLPHSALAWRLACA